MHVVAGNVRVAAAVDIAVAVAADIADATAVATDHAATLHMSTVAQLRNNELGTPATIVKWQVQYTKG